MTIAQELATALQPLLPLRVRAVELADPHLVVLGDRWSLALLGDWQWCRSGTDVDVDWQDEDAEDHTWDLCGLDVVEIVTQESGSSGITLRLSDGSTLAGRSDRSSYEPWTFRHDDLPVVYVGEP